MPEFLQVSTHDSAAVCQSGISSLVQITDDPGELFTQTDGVTLRTEYHTIKGVGKDEERQLPIILEFHLLGNLMANSSICVNSVNDVLVYFCFVLF